LKNSIGGPVTADVYFYTAEKFLCMKPGILAALQLFILIRSCQSRVA
jgi:hypothetical protein